MPRRPSISKPVVVVAVLIAGALMQAATAGPAAAQSPPPDADWRTFPTEHFRITYTPELEPLARRAGAVAERTYALLGDELGEPPTGMIDLLVTDHVDFTNGFAQPFPSNRIVVYARPPISMPQLAYTRDWIELVVAHELVHIFHLDEAGRVGNAIRSVFGQLPMIWPVFPVAGSPTWNVEGLATYYETRLTGAGRVAGSFHDMIVRTAALEDRIPDLDLVSAPHPAWPGGQRSYGYGSRLMQYIADRYGPESHRAIIEATGGSIRPTFLSFDHISKAAVGQPFDALYDEWRDHATRSAHNLAQRVRAAGLTVTEPVAGEGPLAAMPRVSPDGGRLSFAAHDYRSDPASRVVDLATGDLRTLARRNQFGSLLGPAAWLPDGRALVTAQLEMRGPYRAFSDLWRVDLRGHERRLTRGQRLAQPDVHPDGRRVAAVRAHQGGIQLVVHDLDSGATRVLADPAPGDAFDTPRWSPDGDRIAAGRYTDGRVDIVVVDAGTGRVTPVTRDDALDLAPAWSPDGEWLLWWSDRVGIPNIVAVRAAGIAAGPAPGVHQVTNLLTGGFDPEVSRDGRTLYLSVYHHDGWRIEKMPFDPAAWSPLPEPLPRRVPGLLPEPKLSDGRGGAETGASRGAEAGEGAVMARPAEPERGSSSYSAWPTLRPYFWFPEWTTVGGDGGDLSFLGLYTHGRDLLARHEWEASAGVDLGSGRVRGSASWIYRGLGNPDVRLGASRRWSRVGLLKISEEEEEAIFRRTDRLAADAFLWRARWRSRGWMRLGAEVERRELRSHDMSDAELQAARVSLARPRTLVGVSGGPGYSNARYHPFSVSAEGGISGSVGVGRWWNVTAGTRAYDEVVGRLAGYLDFPAWGFADHVLAARAAGLLRDGDDAAAHSIGGVPGGTAGLSAGLDALAVRGAFLPVRGFDSGDRAGTRAWAVSGEWRFPLHMRDAPGRVLGLSLTSLSGAVFADMGDAWCPAQESGQPLAGCSAAAADPLLSAGAELNIDFGVLHNSRALIRMGVAQALSGPGDGQPSFYLAVGPAF